VLYYPKILDVSLHDAAKNAKCSTAFTDLEDTIDGAIQNVQKFVNTSGLAIDDFDRQEVAIKQTIKETRNEFNKHLDDIFVARCTFSHSSQNPSPQLEHHFFAVLVTCSKPQGPQRTGESLDMIEIKR
jgi:hypothetical protein